MASRIAARKPSTWARVVDGPVEILTAHRAVSGGSPMLSGTRVLSFFLDEQAAPVEMQYPLSSAVRTTTSAGRGGNAAETIQGDQPRSSSASRTTGIVHAPGYCPKALDQETRVLPGRRTMFCCQAVLAAALPLRSWRRFPEGFPCRASCPPPGRRPWRGIPAPCSARRYSAPTPRGPPILWPLNEAASTSRLRREKGIFPSACTASVWMRIFRPRRGDASRTARAIAADVLHGAGLVVDQHHGHQERLLVHAPRPRRGDPPCRRACGRTKVQATPCALEDARLLVHGGMLHLRRDDPRLLPSPRRRAGAGPGGRG